MTKTSPDTAFILAAGKGSRLQPFTDHMPKPMVPVGGKPLIDHILKKLESEKIRKVVINTHHLRNILEKHLEKTTCPQIVFSPEQDLLDTGGGVKKALLELGSAPFFMINGDAFWDEKTDKTALGRLSEYWDPEKMDILILLQPVDRMILTKGVGDYDLTPDGRAVRNKEKRGQYMFAGVRITKPTLFKNRTEDIFSFFDLMDEAEQKRQLYGLVHEGAWHHISTPEDLERVNAALEKGCAA
ncbi:MAG: nucleotidyltransferase family protein [Alphaproteobacteria bacterium]|nr:nucleotidyltransferase family protein [Alphaproteobacteria bacterium]